MKALSYLLIVLFSIGALAQDKVIKFATANAVYRSMWKKIVPEFEKQTGIKIQYIHDPDTIFSAHLSMNAVVKGDAEAATAAVAFDDWKTVYLKNFSDGNADGLTYRIVGKDVIIVVAGKSVGVKSLNPQQVKDIFTGKVKSWKDVGGANMPITIIYQPDAKSRLEVIEKRALKGESLTKDAKPVKDLKEVVATMKTTPGAITYIPEDQIDESMMVKLNAEEIGRPITLIVKGKPSDNVMKFINFVGNEGQAILKSKK